MLLSGNATNMAASLFGIIPRELLSLRRQSEKVLKASPSAAQNAGWVCPLCSKRCRISCHCSAERRISVRLPVKLMGSPVNLSNKEEQGTTDQRRRI